MLPVSHFEEQELLEYTEITLSHYYSNYWITDDNIDEFIQTLYESEYFIDKEYLMPKYNIYNTFIIP